MVTGGGANGQLKALIEVLAPFTWSMSTNWLLEPIGSSFRHAQAPWPGPPRRA